jgi:hypothetical protein
MPSNLKLGVLGRATGANPYTTMETSLASDCAGSTTSQVKMSEFITGGLVGVNFGVGQTLANNEIANLYLNFSGITNTPGDPGYRFNRIGTTAGNFTYARLEGTYGSYWAHHFEPSGDLDWTVQVHADQNLPLIQSAIYCRISYKFYDHGYNSGTTNYNQEYQLAFWRSRND